MCTLQASHFNLMSLLKNLSLLHFISGFCCPLKTFRINAPLFSSFLPFKQSPLTKPPLLCFSSHSLFLYLHYLAPAPITFSLEPFSVLSNPQITSVILDSELSVPTLSRAASAQLSFCIVLSLNRHIQLFTLLNNDLHNSFTRSL